MQAALLESGAEMVTVAVRRLDLKAQGEASLLHWLPKGMALLPNTAGCFTADDAVRTCRLARELQLGVSGDRLGEARGAGRSADAAARRRRDAGGGEDAGEGGVHVLPYTSDDPVLARKLEDAGCAAVMPLGAPIGSGLGLRNRTLQMILERAKVPVIVDAGVGTASDAALCMELGVSGLLINTAIACAERPVEMARAMRLATEAGRLAFRAGRIPRKLYGNASSPLGGVIGAGPSRA